MTSKNCTNSSSESPFKKNNQRSNLLNKTGNYEAVNTSGPFMSVIVKIKSFQSLQASEDSVFLGFHPDVSSGSMKKLMGTSGSNPALTEDNHPHERFHDSIPFRFSDTDEV